MLEDAHALAPDPLSFLGDLEVLVGWSLVRSEVSDGSVRLSMLETVREHALGRLEAEASREALRERHAERFLERRCPPRRNSRAGSDTLVALPRARARQHPPRDRVAPGFRSRRGRTAGHRSTQSILARARHMTEARRLLAVGLERARASLPRCAPTPSGRPDVKRRHRATGRQRRSCSSRRFRSSAMSGAARSSPSPCPSSRSWHFVAGISTGQRSCRKRRSMPPASSTTLGRSRLAPHSRGDPLDAGAA